WERIVDLSRRHPLVRGVDLTDNWGQHNALLAGIHSARFNVIVTLDDDLQNPPEEIPKLLAALTPSVDVVYGEPISSSQPTSRRAGAVGLRTILLAVSLRREVMLASGSRAFRAELANGSTDAAGRRVVLDAVLRDGTDRIVSVPVRHEPRAVG